MHLQDLGHPSRLSPTFYCAELCAVTDASTVLVMAAQQCWVSGFRPDLICLIEEPIPWLFLTQNSWQYCNSYSAQIFLLRDWIAEIPPQCKEHQVHINPHPLLGFLLPWHQPGGQAVDRGHDRVFMTHGEQLRAPALWICASWNMQAPLCS